MGAGDSRAAGGGPSPPNHPYAPMGLVGDGGGGSASSSAAEALPPHLSRDLDCYAIRLEAHQSLSLYGYFAPKKTLTWRDVQEHPKITLGACVACGLPAAKLHRMQPDIKVWIRSGKATVNDCEHMGPWCVRRVSPFLSIST
jgi:hypothetical protein